jgi:hypothetical protein
MATGVFSPSSSAHPCSLLVALRLARLPRHGRGARNAALRNPSWSRVPPRLVGEGSGGEGRSLLPPDPTMSDDWPRCKPFPAGGNVAGREGQRHHPKRIFARIASTSILSDSLPVASVTPAADAEDSVHHPPTMGQGSRKSLLFCEMHGISGCSDAILSQRIANLASQILHLPGVFAHEVTRRARKARRAC